MRDRFSSAPPSFKRSSSQPVADTSGRRVPLVRRSATHDLQRDWTRGSPEAGAPGRKHPQWQVEDGWHTSQQTLRIMAGRVDDLFSLLQGLQSGQEDIRMCVQQVLCEMTPGGQTRRQGRGRGGEAASTANLPELAKDMQPVEPEDGPVAADGRESKCTEPGLPGTGALALEQEEGQPPFATISVPVEDLGLALRKYCGLEVRREFAELANFEATVENDSCTSDILMAPVRTSTFHFGRSASCLGICESVLPRAIHPDSMTRLWIDLGSMAVLLFDSIAVPYQISFDPDTRSGFWSVTNWLTLAIWTLDIALGFFSGFYDQGKPELRLRMIAARYVRTFFLVDLVTVACDWAGMLLASIFEGSSSAENVIVLKLFRILKLNRLLRLASALHSGKFALMYDRIIHRARRIGLDHQLQFLLSTLRLMFAVLWLNHIGCCLWFSIQTNAIPNWEKSADIDNFNSRTDLGGEWDYFLGFYWSMTSMVSGASIMSPTTVGELVFTILYVLFGLIVGSTLISSLAAMLLDLQMSNKEQTDNVKLLRQYIYQQDLPEGLSLDLEKEVMSRMKQEKRLGASEVSCLRLLSPAMRSALHYTIYGRPLKEHPFLGVCHILDSSGQFALEVCQEAIDMETQLPGFQVFPTRKTCSGPLFVVLGELEYVVKENDMHRNGGTVSFDTFTLGLSTPRLALKPATRVTSGQWLCELASWLQWKYRGSLSTCVPCEYLRLRAEVFLNTLSRFEELRWLAWQYGTSLCKAVDAEELEQLTDLPLREDLHESVVLSMTPEGRQAMSAGPLKLLKLSANRNRRRLSGMPFSLLQDQVERGECDLVLKGEAVMRIVSVVILRLEREVEKDGRIVRQVLAQISKSTKAEDSKCHLPGCKVRAGELPRQALARMLQEKLYALTQAGLTTDCLHKVDQGVELVEDARPGDSHLVVSSLASLHVSNVIRIGSEGESENRQVISLDPARMQIEIGAPLEHNHAVGARIELDSEVKEKVAMTSGDGVDTKYIRTVFCGSLGSEVCLGRTLRRDRHESQDESSSGRLDAGPTTDYSALLLFPGMGTQSTGGTSSAQLVSAESGLSAGILCAWMDETDYVSLCQRQDSKEQVSQWVGELQSSIQEALDEKYLSSLKPQECAIRVHLTGLETRSESVNSI